MTHQHQELHTIKVNLKMLTKGTPSQGTEDDQSGNDNSFDRVKMMTFITEEIILPLIII